MAVSRGTLPGGFESGQTLSKAPIVSQDYSHSQEHVPTIPTSLCAAPLQGSLVFHSPMKTLMIQNGRPHTCQWGHPAPASRFLPISETMWHFLVIELFVIA